MKGGETVKEQPRERLKQLRRGVKEQEQTEIQLNGVEEALRESEEKYRTLVEQSLQGIVIAQDLPPRLVFANSALAEILGYTVEELQSLSPKEITALVHLEDQEFFFERYRARLTGKPALPRYEVRAVRKDGTIRWVEIFSSRIEYHGKPAVQAAFVDVTERKRAEEALRRKTHQHEQLMDIARHLAESLDVKEVLARIALGAKEIVGARACAIYLLEDDSKTLTPIVSTDPIYKEEILSTPLDLEASFTGKAVKTRRALIFNDAAQSPVGKHIPGTPKEKDERIIAVPFISDHKVLGAICLDRIGIPFTQEDLALAQTFATYATAALQNAQMYHDLQHEVGERKRAEIELKQSFDKLQRLLEELVNVLASTVEMRDPYTAGHQRRVTALACTIAEELNLSQEQIGGIRLAARIHDIGKIYVPAEILSKPGRLTETEFDLIKAHPQVGHDVLKSIEFPWPVAQIILQHHERMDGSGFPQGLSGEDIILEARVLAVADVVEAMSSHRPYRPAHTIEEALAEISQKKGVLYDPRVVDACLKVLAGKGIKSE